MKKSIESTSLTEVIDRIIDKGMEIDIWAKVSLVGFSSVNTWLNYADAAGLLDYDHDH